MLMRMLNPVNEENRESSDRVYNSRMNEEKENLSDCMSVKTSGVVRLLTLSTVILSLLNLFVIFARYGLHKVYLFGFAQQFDMSKEGNVPTFFSALVLVIAAFLFSIIAYYKRRVKDKFTFQWKVLSCIFFYLAFDEAAKLHEMVMIPLKHLYTFSGAFLYVWPVVALVLVFFFIVYFLRFFLALDLYFKIWFALSAVIYVGAALGLEMFEGYYQEQYGSKNVVYAAVTAVEETLEIVGVLILIYTLFLYIKQEIRLNIKLV